MGWIQQNFKEIFISKQRCAYHILAAAEYITIIKWLKIGRIYNWCFYLIYIIAYLIYIIAYPLEKVLSAAIFKEVIIRLWFCLGLCSGYCDINLTTLKDLFYQPI